MPRFPTQPPLISTDVPAGPQVQPNAAIPLAIGGLGAAVTNTSMGLLESVKKIEAQDAVAQASHQERLDADRYVKDLKVKYPTGYITKADDPSSFERNADGTRKTISQNFREWADSRYRGSQENMPSSMAQQLYKERMGQFYTQQIVDVGNDEQVLKVRHADNQFGERRSQDANLLVDTPDTMVLYTLADQYTEDFVNHAKANGFDIHDPQIKNTLVGMQKQYAESTVRGGIVQSLEAGPTARVERVDHWLSVLEGQDNDSMRRTRNGLMTASTMIDPDQKAALKMKLLELRKVASELDITDFRARFEAAQAVLERGDPRDRGLVSKGAIQQELGTYVMSKKNGHQGLAPSVAQEMMADLEASDQLGRLKGPEALSMPLPQYGAMMKHGSDLVRQNAQANGIDPVIGAKSQQAFEKKAAADYKFWESKSQEDYQKAAQMRFPEAKRMYSLLTDDPMSVSGKGAVIQSTMKSLEVRNRRDFPGQGDLYWRVLPKELSEAWSNKLKDPKYSVQATSMAVRSMAKEYGEYYPDLMDQMIRDKNLHEGWRYAALLPGSLQTSDVVGALKADPEAVRTSLIAAAGGADISKEFDDYARVESAAFIASVAHERPSDLMSQNRAKAMAHVLSTKAKMLYIDSGGTIDVNQAIKQANEALVGRNFNMFQVSTPNGKVQAKIPKSLATEEETRAIRDVAERNFSKPEFLKTMKIVVPTAPDGKTPSEWGEEFYNQVSNTYIPKFTKKGVKLEYQDRKNNSFVPVFTKDGHGNDVELEIPYKKMLEMVPAKKSWSEIFQALPDPIGY
jgi:hypothetical protein